MSKPIETIQSPLKKVSLAYAANPAIIDGDKVISYREYFMLASQVANKLKQLGLNKKKPLGILSRNNLELPIIIMAAMHLGCPVMPLNPRFPDEAAQEYLKQGNCKTLVTDRSDFPESSGNTLLQIDDILTDLPNPLDIANLPFNQPAVYILTSGSTGQPKIAVLSARNFYFNAMGSNENLPLTAGDRWLLSLPLYHVGGLGILFRTQLIGATMVIGNPGDINVDTILQKKITHISMVQTQLYRLLRADNLGELTGKLKAVLLGGSSISFSLIKKTREYDIPIFLSYGLTEMASQVTTTSANPSKKELETSGKLLKFREIELSRTDEILVRGETLFMGYLKDGKIDPSTDKKGWFHTDDRAWLDKDNFLHVTGRTDEMFISGGENIYPDEILEALKDYPDLHVFVTISIKDEEYGYRPVAFTGGIELNDESLKKINAHLRKKLPKYKIPVAFIPFPDFSNNPDLKVSADILLKLAVEKIEEMKKKKEK